MGGSSSSVAESGAGVNVPQVPGNIAGCALRREIRDNLDAMATTDPQYNTAARQREWPFDAAHPDLPTPDLKP